jgi:hypothetical protein
VRKGWLLTIVVGLIVAGCGSGSSSTARRKALATLRTQAERNSLPSDLSQCVFARARELSTARLRALATAGSHSDSAGRQLIADEVDTCLSAGHGATALRQQIVAGIGTSATGSGQPPQLVSCIESKAAALPTSELLRLVDASVQGRATLDTYAHQLGVTMGAQCMSEPALGPLLRAKFLAPIKAGLAAAHYSQAFKTCLLQKAKTVPATTIVRLALARIEARSRAAAITEGEALGRTFARQCAAAGKRP